MWRLSGAGDEAGECIFPPSYDCTRVKYPRCGAGCDWRGSKHRINRRSTHGTRQHGHSNNRQLVKNLSTVFDRSSVPWSCPCCFMKVQPLPHVRAAVQLRMVQHWDGCSSLPRCSARAHIKGCAGTRSKCKRLRGGKLYCCRPCTLTPTHRRSWEPKILAAAVGATVRAAISRGTRTRLWGRRRRSQPPAYGAVRERLSKSWQRPGQA